MSTIDNLQEAFTEESRTAVKYMAFARKAREEGRDSAADQFERAATDEMEHARRNLELLQRIGSTEDNLQSSIYGEVAEYVNRYPEFIQDALAEDRQEIADSFRLAADSQQRHSENFMETLEEIKTEGSSGGGESA